MPTEHSSDVKFEIGHVLFIDIVGYSKLLINEQSDQIQKLKGIVRGTEQVRLAETEGKLLRYQQVTVARSFFGIAQKRRFYARWRSPRSCKSIRGQKKSLSWGFGWEFTAGRSMKLLILTNKRTSLVRESTSRSE